MRFLVGVVLAAHRRIAAKPWCLDFYAALAFTIVSLFIYATSFPTHTPSSDGHYTWMYARSLAYDHDLDFTNDYGLCGDPFSIGWTTPAHRPANLFYFGPAIFWTPVVWILKHFVHGDPRVAGGCTGAIPTITLAISSVAGGATVFATSALVRRIVSARVAALAALLTGFGGLLLYFTALDASYSHAYDAMCVAAYLLSLVRLRENGPRLSRLALAGVLLGLAILQRSSNAVFFWIAPFALATEPTSAALRRAILPSVQLGLVGFATGIAPLAMINRAIYGRFLLYAHGPHFLHPGHAHPWLLLFDQRGGLFAWAPILWIAAVGLPMLLRRRDVRWLVWPLGACGLFELYVSSAALDWQGGRRLANLTPLFAMALALVADRIARFLVRRPRRLETTLALVAIAAVAWGNGSVCGGFAAGKIKWDEPLTTADRWGNGQTAVLAQGDRTAGPLTALPAAWIFAARYRLRPSAFGWAVHPAWYARDMHTLEYTASGFSFDAPHAAGLLRGFRVEPGHGGSCMTSRDAAAVFAVQWPFATRARLLYDADEPDVITIGSRSFFGFRTTWADRIALPPGKLRKAFVRIPPGGFDSGVNEIELTHEAAPGKTCLRSLEFLDDTRYPAAPEATASPPIQLWHALAYDEGAGSSPTAAIGEGGAWVVELDERERGQILEHDGRRGELLRPRVVERYAFRPRVAASGASLVAVEQEQPGPGGLAVRVGDVSTTDPSLPVVTWTARVRYATGYHPSVAASPDRIVEIHQTDARPGPLSLRFGKREGRSIIWSADQNVGTGCEAAVAISSKWIVEAHQTGSDAGPLVLRVGKLEGDAVAWGAPEPYGTGAAPAIALRGDGIVEAHQEKLDAAHLWIGVGTIAPDGRITWSYRRHYEDGAQPFLAIDEASGIGLELHQGDVSASQLWSHDFDGP